MNISDSMKSVLALGLGVLVIGGGLVYWQYSARSEALSRVQSLQSKIPNETELKTDLEKSGEELAEFREKLAHLEKSVPSAAYIPTLLMELEKVGSDNKLSVNGVRPVLATGGTDDSGEEKPYQELEIDITGQGSYGAVMDLVASLQSFPKILAVKTIGLSPQTNIQSKSKDLDATVRLRAFVFKDKLETEEAKLSGTEVSSR